jgi:hypothetical protein
MENPGSSAVAGTSANNGEVSVDWAIMLDLFGAIRKVCVCSDKFLEVSHVESTATDEEIEAAGDNLRNAVKQAKHHHDRSEFSFFP